MLSFCAELCRAIRNRTIVRNIRAIFPIGKLVIGMTFFLIAVDLFIHSFLLLPKKHPFLQGSFHVMIFQFRWLCPQGIENAL